MSVWNRSWSVLAERSRSTGHSVGTVNEDFAVEVHAPLVAQLLLLVDPSRHEVAALLDAGVDAAQYDETTGASALMLAAALARGVAVAGADAETVAKREAYLAKVLDANQNTEHN